MMQGKIAVHSSMAFGSDQTAVFKLCLIRILTEKAEKDKIEIDYVHWLKDPIPFGWLKKILTEHMSFRGAMACLRPWSTPTPLPNLTVEEAPLRILIRGNIGSWKVGPIQDLRTLEASQIYEALDIGDEWLVAIFGKDVDPPEEDDLPEPASSSKTRSPKIPDDKLDFDDGSDGYSPSVLDDDLVPLCPPAHEEEPTEAVASHPGSLKPLFGFRRIFEKLPKLFGKDENQAKRLILGLHERLWRAPATDVRNIFKRCGMPPAVCQLAADAVSTRRICRKFARSGRRPQWNSASVSTRPFRLTSSSTTGNGTCW